MESGVVIDVENDNIAGNKPKGAKMLKGSLVGNMQRRTLADISNLPLRNQDVKSTLASVNAKHYIDKLHQENVTLVKLLEDRNKIIEFSAIELQKLRINYQKVQQQNLQLAQANSHMLAELNLGKDKLKVLQHELGCKSGLLKAREFEYKDKTETVGCENYPKVGSIKCDEAGDFSEVGKGDNNFSNAKRKRQLKIRAVENAPIEPAEAKGKIDEKRRTCSRRQSAGLNNSGEQELIQDLSESFKPATATKPGQTKAKVDEARQFSRRQSARLGNYGEWEQLNEDLSESLATIMVQSTKADKKRVSLTRRSARFKPQELAQERTEDLLKIDNTKLSVSPLHNDQTHGSCSMSSVSSIQNECHASNGAPEPENQERRRSSVRPLRRAAEKVQSYKEIPLNAKMRRAE